MMLSKSQNNISLKKNISWTFLSNIIFSFSQWGILITITKLGTPSMVGQYALGLAVTAPFFMFLDLRLRILMVTDADKNFDFSNYYNLRVLTTILALAAISIGSFIISNEFDTVVIIILVGLIKSLESISDIYYGTSQRIERMNVIAYSKILKGILSIIIFLSAFYISNNLTISLIVLFIVKLILLFSYDSIESKKSLNLINNMVGSSNDTRSFKRMKEIFIISLPLGVVATLDSLSVNIPRYFIQYNLGEEQLGYFAAIAYLMLVGSTITNAIAQSIIPRLSKYYKENKIKRFKMLLYQLILFTTIIGVAGISFSLLLGKQFLTIFYTAEYARYSNLLIIVMVASLLGYVASILYTAINATRAFKFQLPIYILTIIMITITSFWLIPKYHLLGAGYVMILGMMIKVIGSAVVLYRVIKNTFIYE